jgi:hypothetical protein
LEYDRLGEEKSNIEKQRNELFKKYWYTKQAFFYRRKKLGL